MTKKSTQKKGSIQRVEIDAFCYRSIHCPFCGQRVVENDGEEIFDFDPCEHTLFVAHDDGFEYRSELFDEHLGIVGVDDMEVEQKFEDVPGIDGITDLVDIPDSIKFASYVPAPSCMGSYCGFAALDDEDDDDDED